MTNFNEKTQLPYGVIAGASLHPDVQADLWDAAHGDELDHFEGQLRSLCERYGYSEEQTDEIVEQWIASEYGVISTDDFDFDHGPSEEPCAQIVYEGVTLVISHLGGAMIVTSIDGPVCSVASMCSPCVPGAADLDSGYGSIRCHGVPFEWLSEDEPESLVAPKQEPPPSPYNRERIAWEIEQTASGANYYGNALLVASGMPETTHNDRLVLRQVMFGYHTFDNTERLRAIADNIRSHDDSLGAPKQEQQDYMCLPTLAHLKQYPVSKGDLAKDLYPNITYDTALPQSWVDAMYQRGFDDVTGQFVWGYPDPKDSHGQPLPLTTDAVSILSQLARWI
jgi:hypothetical protein